MKFSIKHFVRTLFKKFLGIILPVLFYPIRCLYCEKNVIIIQTYSPHRYGGNPRYLFEYLSEKTNYNVYWVTNSEEIRKYLDRKGYKYISNKNIWKKLLVTWSARIVIDSGSVYYNFLNLIPHSAIKICTMHGSGPKLAIFKYKRLQRTISSIKKINKFDFFSFCSKHAEMMIGKNQLLLHSEKMVMLGAPKSDKFYNKKFVEQSYYTKKHISSIIPNYDNNAKFIYYTPTYREYAYKLPIFEIIGFNEQKFQEYLDKNNIYFIYSFHSSSAFTKTLKHSNKIIFFSYEEYPLIDNNQLLMEVDLVINDYSTISTDAAIINKPQLFIMPDYNEMEETRGFAEDMRSMVPGPEVFKFNELVDYINKYLDNPLIYIKENSSRINLLLARYMDNRISNSCELYKNFIDNII